MYVECAEFAFSLHFLEPAYADNYPVFILRSVLGMQLRKMSCLELRKPKSLVQTDENGQNQVKKCAECAYHEKCTYSTIFETIIPKKNELLAGTERASHPFAFTRNSKFSFKNREIQDFDFSFVLFGDAIKIFPYIYASFVLAGKTGIFKNRTHFEITDVKVKNESILIEEDSIDLNFENDVLNFQENNENSKKWNGEILVELISPLRFKTNGRYSKEFSAVEFFKMLHRRAKTLITLYGDGEIFAYESSLCEVEIAEKNLRWHDYSHYSSRQKKSMELGGVVGTFKLEGNFSEMELFLLEMAQKCNAGKSTNFGLGQIKLWKNLKSLS